MPATKKNPKTKDELDQVLVEFVATLAAIGKSGGEIARSLADDYANCAGEVTELLAVIENLRSLAEALDQVRDGSVYQWMKLSPRVKVTAKAIQQMSILLSLPAPPGQGGA